MTWDLFSAAAAEREAAARRARPAVDNEALARAVAAAQAERGAGAPGATAWLAAAPARGEGWSVSALNALAREVVEGVLPPVWVVGEVTNFTRARSGHCYFSLRDRSAQLRCVMWRDEARRLPTAPAEGMEVRALGRLTIYEARGEFQLVVSELEGRGEGLWKLAFERLRAQLDAEGLTAPERKRALPRCPARIGVVTSADGAALRDIVSVIGRRAPWAELVLSGCRVQGDGAAAEIAAAIGRLSAAGLVEVLIVGRGGGSREDLWAFNDEAVARAICASPVPVVSAVGHETDFTITDLVADLRAPTPSAAAEAVVPDAAALRRELLGYGQRMGLAMQQALAGARAEHADASAVLAGALQRGLRARRERLAAAAARLQALSPLAVLARGYAVALGADGAVLRRPADFGARMPFTLRLADGSVPCRVEEAFEA